MHASDIMKATSIKYSVAYMCTKSNEKLKPAQNFE